jgi:hypothetical protein
MKNYNLITITIKFVSSKDTSALCWPPDRGGPANMHVSQKPLETLALG